MAGWSGISIAITNSAIITSVPHEQSGDPELRKQERLLNVFRLNAPDPSRQRLQKEREEGNEKEEAAAGAIVLRRWCTLDVFSFVSGSCHCLGGSVLLLPTTSFRRELSHSPGASPFACGVPPRILTDAPAADLVPFLTIILQLEHAHYIVRFEGRDALSGGRGCKRRLAFVGASGHTR